MFEKCLIIGLGQIGMGYDLTLDSDKHIYTHARAFMLHSEFDLIGAVDPSEKQRSVFERHYNKPVYQSLVRALEIELPDVVVIANPTTEHCETLKTILQNSKVKVILCEKPLAYDLAEAREMVKVCEKAGVKLFVNYMRRSDPGVVEIKKRIEGGEILSPIKGFAWYSKGFFHNGSHFFNLLEYWLGAFQKAYVLNSGRLWDEHDSEPDVHVEFERGKIFFQAAWEESYSHYTIELLSPSGRLRYDQGGESISWQGTHSDPIFSGYRSLMTDSETIPNRMNRYQWSVIEELVNTLNERPHNLCSGRQALLTLEAMQQIIKQK